MKTCRKCGVEKALAEFYKSKKHPSGLQYACKACDRKRLAAHDAIHPNRGQESHLRLTYGLTVQGYNRLLKEQGGTCAICYRPGLSKRLAVDHSHSTGTNRGLLCQPCNMALGLYEDSPTRLRRAAEYLEEHAKRLLSENSEATQELPIPRLETPQAA
ncbi:MAG: endonuclease VII domain-containing protein [Cetobacterium sp.]